MSENIELKSFSGNIAVGIDGIEEYHEIDEAVSSEAKPQNRISRNHSKTITEHDFFVQYDVKSVHKKPGKKKSNKTKLNTSNLMDIINSELASISSPVSEELVTTKIDYNKTQQNTYLRSSRMGNPFKKVFGFLPENG